MLIRSVRWGKFRKDPRSVSMVVKRIPERARRRYYSVLSGTGSPAILWQSYYTVPWGSNHRLDRCYCYRPESGDAQGNLRHRFCYGAGFVDYYQRWGYEDKTYWPGMSSDVELPEQLVVLYEDEPNIGRRPVWVARENVSLMITHEPHQDPINWIWIKGEGVFSQEKILRVSFANITKEVPVSCETEDNGVCQFRVSLQGIVIGPSVSFEFPLSKDEKLYYLRVRTQYLPNLNEVDPRFPDIDFPAILVARDQPRITLKPDENRAIKFVFPMKFWTLDVEIHANDVLWILTPPFNAYRYMVSSDPDGIEYSVIGHPPVITKTMFTGVMIRSPDDRLGIVFDLE